MKDILETIFQEFLQLIRTESGEEFKTFQTSMYLIEHENYKYQVFDEARENLGSKWWKEGDIGTGLIQKGIVSAIKPTVRYNSKSQTNNLVYWRKKSSFADRPKSKSLEGTLFAFYKNKIKDSEAFDQLSSEGLDYQFIAYLFFIKDRNQYLPISQERFDGIFEFLGRSDFKTRNNISWVNYSEFCKIIKDVRAFLKTKDKDSTLLDAHSFLWIIGNQNKFMDSSSGQTEPDIREGFPPDYKPFWQFPDPDLDPDLYPDRNLHSFTVATIITKEQWVEILSDEELTNEYDLDLFQILLGQTDNKGYASQIGIELGHSGVTPQSPINLEIGRFGKRIAGKYQVQLTKRDDDSIRYWDLFFIGSNEGSKFAWQLKPELVSALINIGLNVEAKSPDELPNGTNTDLYEGLKRIITVNSYERSSTARLLCVNHWKAICSVCDFDFERVYGKIGKGFIHVHHLNPVSEIGEAYKVNPVRDLRPVCPNCHAMLHRGEKTLSIDELKRIIVSKSETD